MHTYESRHTFHVDGDYTPRNSLYYVWHEPHGSRPEETHRFKCGKEAMAAIIEWYWSFLRIPGPE
jgi:hypothetical protein